MKTLQELEAERVRLKPFTVGRPPLGSYQLFMTAMEVANQYAEVVDRLVKTLTEIRELGASHEDGYGKCFNLQAVAANEILTELGKDNHANNNRRTSCCFAGDDS